MAWGGGGRGAGQDYEKQKSAGEAMGQKKTTIQNNHPQAHEVFPVGGLALDRYYEHRYSNACVEAKKGPFGTTKQKKNVTAKDATVKPYNHCFPQFSFLRANYIYPVYIILSFCGPTIALYY